MPKKSLTNKNLLYLLIGAFSLFLFIEASYLIGLIVKHLLIMVEVNPLITFISTELVEIIVFISFTFYGLKFLSSNIYSLLQLKSIAIRIIIVAIIVQVFQVLYWTSSGYFEDLSINFESYASYLTENYMLQFISSIVAYTKYLIFALILFNYISSDD